MPKFIIGYGIAEHTDVIEAKDQEVALNEAAGRACLNGSELNDDVWAEPYSELRAWDLGLLENPRNEKQQAWWG